MTLRNGIIVLCLLGLSSSPNAEPSGGIAFQFDHLSYLPSAHTGAANMLTGSVGVSPIEWVSFETRISLNFADIASEFDRKPDPGQTRLFFRAGMYARANLPIPLHDNFAIYALAGREYSALQTGFCGHTLIEHTNSNGGTYHYKCDFYRESRNGFSYGGGLRFGSMKDGYLSLEAIRMPAQDHGYGFTSYSLILGAGF